ncbi:hypothetical protein A3767_23060 [Oleiphilus sp. HI0133]|nr:hypothetical protein A3767_23060 [Oleiphilus sp. HI0133]
MLADPLPKIPPLEKQQLEGSFNALFICSWADDEPFLEIIEAAKLLPNDYRIYITGNWKKVTNQLPNKIPDNVVLTGFISTEDFDALLISSQVSIDLTTREGCLVCGAYEALAIAKPQILSDTKTLRKTFSQGAIFTQNSAKDIANAILDAHKDLPTLQKDAELQRTKFISIWSKQRDTFEEHLTKLTRSTYRQ